MSDPSSRALVLLAHGSPDPQWRAPMEAVLAAVRAQAPHVPACCAYLDACPPDLAAAVQQLADAGSRRMSVLPLFLGMGKHARQDIPRLVEQARRAHPGCDICLLPAVGEAPRVVQLLAQLALEATRQGAA